MTARRAPAPACLVVSLRSGVARRATIGAALDALGIEHAFVDAVDARDGLDAASEARIDRRAHPWLSDAEFACALSHRYALERFLDGDASHALVLEDDALPGEGLAPFLAGAHYRHAPLMLLHHSRARVFGERRPLFDKVVARPLAIGCTAAVAYTVDRAAARALIAANTPVRQVADWPMDIAELGACVIEPMLVGHPPRVPGQSTLAAERISRPADPMRFLSRRYLVRRWRKLRSTRIS